MILGVSWGGQLVYFLTAFAFGTLGGVVVKWLIIKPRKINKIERGLVDLFASVVVTLLYLLSVEFGGKGQITAYSVVAFMLGVVLSVKTLTKIVGAFRARRAFGKTLKK